MPGTDGYEFIQRVRELGPNEGGLTPAMALTAYALSEDRARALRAGYQHHVPKPVDAMEIMETIAALLRWRS